MKEQRKQNEGEKKKKKTNLEEKQRTKKSKVRGKNYERTRKKESIIGSEMFL